MSFELPQLGTSSTDVLSKNSLAPVLDEGSLTTSLTGLGRSNQSLLFVDKSVTDYQQLLAGVTPGTEIHVLEPGQDGVTQITNTLLGRQNIASLHIVSHGEAGGVDFGSSALNSIDLPQYAAQLKTWSKALTNDADILFYGCNVAQGQLGQTFVQNISQVTGADVAASDNLTGNSSLGGDWNLEVATGAIETSPIFSTDVLNSYKGTLADVPTLTVGATSLNYTENAAAGLVAPNLTVTGSDGIDGARVSIGTNFDINDQLGFAGQSGTSSTINGLTWSYNTTTGILSLVGAGSAATYQAVLRQVTYSNTSENPTTGDRAIQFALGTNLANPDNGHFYEFVNAGSPISWTAARDAAAARNYFGLQGYLVTVTSAAESSFVSSKLQGEGWLGASDAAVEGEWRWVTGPEVGQQFWQGLGQNGSPVGGGYNNWNSLEPNNSNDEDYGQFLLDGKWNDLRNNAGSISGYVVEYGGLAGDPTLQLTGNATVTVTAVNDAPTIAAPASVTVVEDSTTAITDITFADVDAGSDSVTATFSAAAGTLAAVGSGGVTVGGTSSNLTLNGTIANLNAFIAASKLTYQTVLNSNTAVNLGVSINDNGNTPAPSLTTTKNIAINITPVNDAPSLTGNATLAAVTQNATNPSGSTITSLFGNLFTDPDTSASLSGLAIVGNTANTTTEGKWQYSIDGTTWANVGTVADDGTALALSASTLVRFVPAIGYKGTPSGLIVRALDNSYSGGFTNSTTLVTVNTTTNGSTTAIAATTVALNTSVTQSLPNILWRNKASGENTIWGLNGFSVQSNNLITQVADQNWQIAGTADFNGDGKSDILWRNKASGENTIWGLNGFSVQSNNLITQVADQNWQIAGTADFNGDGKSDILWRNKASGENTIWGLNGFSVQSNNLITQVAEQDWQIAGTADFNGDGKSDILWRNKASGQNTIWEMNGFSVQSNNLITQVAEQDWQIAGTADFNGDSKSDILWRNKATGQNTIWGMNGFSVQSNNLITQVADQNWQIAGRA
ncbi:DUF4347 domain-containing protein [Nostoc sp.]|uniref:DUF4347 domain-containing protein n=1 Tax=Nostoc sp. TaxID=1180 RepID=UPI002FFA8403